MPCSTPRLAENAWLTPLPRCTCSSFPVLELRGSLARDILQLAACVRAFASSQERDRTAPILEGAFRCESDAVWPLVAHAAWYCQFSARLAKDASPGAVEGGQPGEQSPRQLLLLHPFPRALLLKAAGYVLGLHAFLGAFPPASNLTVDMARAVLDDAAEEGGLVLDEWRSTLVGVGNVEGLSGSSPDLASLLTDLAIPASFATARAVVGALLSNQAMLATQTPPTPPCTPPPFLSSSLVLDSTNAVDIVRRSRLPTKGRVEEKSCTRCGDRTELKRRTGMESGRWVAWEQGWESRCACGGAWRYQGVQV